MITTARYSWSLEWRCPRLPRFVCTSCLLHWLYEVGGAKYIYIYMYIKHSLHTHIITCLCCDYVVTSGGSPQRYMALFSEHAIREEKARKTELGVEVLRRLMACLQRSAILFFQPCNIFGFGLILRRIHRFCSPEQSPDPVEREQPPQIHQPAPFRRLSACPYLVPLENNAAPVGRWSQGIPDFLLGPYASSSASALCTSTASC